MRGITVTIHPKEVQDLNSIGEVVFRYGDDIAVDNVLVAPSSAEEVLEADNLYGKKAVYTLAIPKGDTNDWQDQWVTFFGLDWQTFGIPLEGIDSLVPTAWNKKVTVMRRE